MPLTVGSRLGHYNVTALIGEGGMGQVYQATDTTLDRDVALKVLPDAFTADPERLARCSLGKPRRNCFFSAVTAPLFTLSLSPTFSRRTRGLALSARW